MKLAGWIKRSGRNHMELWGKYGFSSYVSGEPWQQAESAVILLKQYFETQSPKLVILETDEVFTGNNSRAAVLATKAGEYVPVFRYHNNWKKFRLSSLAKRPHYSYHSVAMGEFIQTTAREYSGPADYMSASGKSEEIPQEALDSLDVFVQLCRDHGAQLLLLNVPCATSWTDGRHAAVQAYADRQGIPYLDLNLCTKKVGLDWSADTADGGTHLNLKGAEKVTDYLGQYIEEHYHPKDHRGDSAYALWQEDEQTFQSNYPA